MHSINKLLDFDPNLQKYKDTYIYNLYCEQMGHIMHSHECFSPRDTTKSWLSPLVEGLALVFTNSTEDDVAKLSEMR